MRDSFIFYRSFYEAIKDLPRDIQGEIYTAIMEYSLYGKETENLKPVARSIFTLIKPQIDVNNKRFDNGCKGGRPKRVVENNQALTENKPNNNQETTNDKPNNNHNVNQNDNIPPPIPQQAGGDLDEGSSSFLSQILKDGVHRNFDGLVKSMERLSISQSQQDEIMKLSNYGEIGHEVWKLLIECEASLGKSKYDRSRIKMPGNFILSKLKPKSDESTP